MLAWEIFYQQITDRSTLKLSIGKLLDTARLETRRYASLILIDPLFMFLTAARSQKSMLTTDR
jgi:hypothetical protein